MFTLLRIDEDRERRRALISELPPWHSSGPWSELWDDKWREEAPGIQAVEIAKQTNSLVLWLLISDSEICLSRYFNGLDVIYL